MIKPNLTTLETAPLASPNALSPEEITRLGVQSGAESGAFAQMLAQIHAQTTVLPKEKTDASSAKTVEGGVGVGFKPSQKQENAGAGRASLQGQSVHGHQPVAAAISNDAWAETKAHKAIAQGTIPGAARVVHEKKNEGKSGTKAAPEVAQAALKLGTARVAGLSLNGKAVSARADGSPVLLDENGTSLTVGAKDPDKNLGVYLSKEGKNALEDGRLNELLASQETNEKKPQTLDDAFVESAKTHKGMAIATHAQNISEATKDAALTATEEPAVATENAAVETYKDKKIEAGAKHSAAAKDIQAEDAQNTQKTKQGTEESFSDTLSQNGSERGQSEALLQSETPKSATSTLDFQELTTPLDASKFVQAQRQGDAPLAAARLAELLGARLEFLTRGNERSLTLTLNPRELGEIRAQLVTNGETTDLHLKAEKETIGKSLEMAVPELTRMLQKVGVTVGQISIEYGLADFNQSGGDLQQRQAREGAESNLGRENGLAGALPGSAAPAAKTRLTHDGVIDVVA